MARLPPFGVTSQSFAPLRPSPCRKHGQTKMNTPTHAESVRRVGSRLPCDSTDYHNAAHLVLCSPVTARERRRNALSFGLWTLHGYHLGDGYRHALAIVKQPNAEPVGVPFIKGNPILSRFYYVVKHFFKLFKKFFDAVKDPKNGVGGRFGWRVRFPACVVVVGVRSCRRWSGGWLVWWGRWVSVGTQTDRGVPSPPPKTKINFVKTWIDIHRTT